MMTHIFTFMPKKPNLYPLKKKPEQLRWYATLRILKQQVISTFICQPLRVVLFRKDIDFSPNSSEHNSLITTLLQVLGLLIYSQW